MKHLLFIICLMLIPRMAEAQVIDISKMAQVEAILSNGIEQFGAKSGLVVIMDVKTGRIAATKGDEIVERHQSQLVRMPNLLAALETGKVSLNDVVDTKEGVLEIKGGMLKDHNWRRGGYGKISVKQGFMSNSQIAQYKSIRKAWGEDSLSHYTGLEKIGYGLPIEYEGLGKLPEVSYFEDAMYADITPLQTLAFLNAIANNGKMVQPHANGDSVVVLKELVASKENIVKMQDVMRSTITDGLGKKANSDKVKVAGFGGTVAEEDCSYRMEFCGYFPYDNPQYTVLIVLNKEGLPASSGGMNGWLFKEIAELLIQK